MRARIAVDMKRRELVDRLQEKRRLLAYLARKEQKTSSDSSMKSLKTKMIFEGLWAKGHKGRLGASRLVRKRCMVTGHGRRANRRFGLRRQRLRFLGRQGAVGGLRRAVW